MTEPDWLGHYSKIEDRVISFAKPDDGIGRAWQGHDVDTRRLFAESTITETIEDIVNEIAEGDTTLYGDGAREVKHKLKEEFKQSDSE